MADPIQSWSWVTFSKPNPKFLEPTEPTKVFTRPNPTHHRHLVWHIRLYRKLYTPTVTRHRQVYSSQLEWKSEESLIQPPLQYRSSTDSTVFADSRDLNILSILVLEVHPQWYLKYQYIVVVTVYWQAVKISLTPSLITMQNSVAVSHALCAHLGGTGILGTLGTPPPLVMGRGWPHRNTLPHAKFGHCGSDHTDVIMEIRQKNLTHRVTLFKVTQGH